MWERNSGSAQTTNHKSFPHVMSIFAIIEKKNKEKYKYIKKSLIMSSYCCVFSLGVPLMISLSSHCTDKRLQNRHWVEIELFYLEFLRRIWYNNASMVMPIGLSHALDKKLIFWNTRSGGFLYIIVFKTRYSQAVNHPNTLLALQVLTSGIKWDPVFSL